MTSTTPQSAIDNWGKERTRPMTREEAMEKATEIVDRMGNSPDLNRSGYKIDGWKPPTLEERTASIIQIAMFLIGPQFGLVDRVIEATTGHKPPHTSICRSCQQPRVEGALGSCESPGEHVDWDPRDAPPGY